MVLLVHNSVLPQCRKIRILMAEKKMLFVLKEENPWMLSKDIMKINPAGELPVFIYDGNIISGNYAITEFLEETYTQNRLINGNNKERAEVRRLIDWFDNKFSREVYQYIAGISVSIWNILIGLLNEIIIWPAIISLLPILVPPLKYQL